MEGFISTTREGMDAINNTKESSVCAHTNLTFEASFIGPVYNRASITLLQNITLLSPTNEPVSVATSCRESHSKSWKAFTSRAHAGQ
jgi:hypothetical protein